MSTVALSVSFSVFVGLIWAVAFPVVVTLVYADTKRHTSRVDRLDTWRLSVLVSTTALATWNALWVTQVPGIFLDATTIWYACAFGVLTFVVVSFYVARVKTSQ